MKAIFACDGSARARDRGRELDREEADPTRFANQLNLILARPY